MKKQLQDEMLKCKTLEEMLNLLKKYYVVTSEVGIIVKTLIISNLNAQLEKKLSHEIIEQLKKCNTFGDMLAIFSQEYKGVKIEENKKQRIVIGLSTIVTMTRLKLK
jgi:hypothetical protein